MPHRLLLLLACAGSAAEVAAPAAPEAPPAAAATIAATMDTIRVVADAPARRDAAAAPPLSATLGDGLRDPREEPLFVGYAMPVQLQFLADRLDLERIGWRYRAARDSTAPEAR
jgi:hypothetical protein